MITLIIASLTLGIISIMNIKINEKLNNIEIKLIQIQNKNKEEED